MSKSQVNISMILATICMIRDESNASTINLSDCFHCARSDAPHYDVDGDLGALTNPGTAAGPLAWLAFMACGHYDATPIEDGVSLVDAVKARVGLNDDEIAMVIDGTASEMAEWSLAMKQGKAAQIEFRRTAAEARLWYVLTMACKRCPQARRLYAKAVLRTDSMYRNWFGPKSVLMSA